MSRVLSLLLNLWALGKYVSWLGNEGWGAIVLIVIIGNIASTLADLGLGVGTINAMVGALDNDDQSKANRILATHNSLSLVLGLLTIVPMLACFWAGYIKGVGHDLPGLLFYLVTAGTTIFVLIINGQNAGLVTRGQYTYIALIATIAALVNTFVSLALVYHFRHPWGFMAGNFISSFFTLCAYELKLKQLGFGGNRLGFFWADFASVIAYVKRSWITNSAQLISGLDRMVLNSVLGQAPLGVYDQSVRIPSTLCSTMPIAQVFPAEIAKANIEGPKAMHDAYWKVFPATMALMMAILVIPSAFGESFLRLFLKEVTPEMGLLFILASIDAASSVYGSMYAVFSNASAKPHLTAPFVWFMLLGSALLAYPAALHFGIIGVALTRVVLQLVQFYALEWAVKRFLIPGLNLSRAIRRKLVIMGIAGVFWFIGYSAFKQLHLSHLPFASLALAAALSYLYMLSVVAIRVVKLPTKLESVLPKFARN